MQDGLSANFKIKWNPTDGMKLETPNRPNDAAVVEVLHCLRPFVLQDEDTYFFKVAKTLQSGVRDKRFNAYLKPYKDRFTGDDQKDLIRLYTFNVDVSQFDPSWIAGEVPQEFAGKHLQMNTEKALKLWLYAFEYHRNQDDQREYEQRTGGRPDELALTVFRSLLAGKIEAILKFANLLVALEKAPGTTRTEV